MVTVVDLPVSTYTACKKSLYQNAYSTKRLKMVLTMFSCVCARDDRWILRCRSVNGQSVSRTVDGSICPLSQDKVLKV